MVRGTMRSQGKQLLDLSISLLAVALVLQSVVAYEETEFTSNGNGGNTWKIESALRKNGNERQWGGIGEIVGRSGNCKEQYGVLPCSVSLGGNAALLVIYGYMMLKAAELLSEGSELLLTVMSPGIIGGLVLPICGAFPDALLITGTCSWRQGGDI